MKLSTHLPRLNEKNGVFLCSDLRHRESTRRYRVPIEHRLFKMFGGGFDEALDTAITSGGGETARQITESLAATGGIGLFAAKGWPFGGRDGKREPTQEEHGALLIVPPQHWDDELDELREWASDVFEDSDEMHYTLDDIAVFAKINFTPDRWFYVRSGPLEGKIFFWRHDDASDLTEPWADDFVSWADRVWREVPKLFGGIIRWNRAASPDDDCPDDAELFPLEYVLEQSTA